ncbi:hypothetical protein GCM10007857_87590 [Bradyrhizobium iriomotense]|uniref:Urease accessory protein UreE C-terminal domain-containing protein n=1 Tax=Bradyrhizobium iriomotense TaxID=441950 RepID=A0ABQ6BEU2_9BRAD|nr:hypothetical protein GCM10007857_87590 [Bradyrhizobium iriomotense]
MAQRDGLPARLLHRLMVGEEIEHGLVDAYDQPAIDRDADEQRHDALRCRTHVVLRRRGEFLLAFRLPPGLVIAGQILFEDELAVACDDDRMDGGRALIEACGDAAESRAIHADAVGRRSHPTVVD